MDWQRQRRQRTYFGGGAPDPNVIDYAFNRAGGEILAYLTYAIVSHLPMDRFASEVIFHFRERLSQTIKSTELEEKLKLFWANCCDPQRSVNEWKDIYIFGIEALPRLHKQKVDWIKERSVALKEILNHEGSPRVLRSAMQASPSFRKGSRKKSPALNQDKQRRAATARQVLNGRCSPRRNTKRKRILARLPSVSNETTTINQHQTITERTLFSLEVPDSQGTGPASIGSVSSPSPSARATYGTRRGQSPAARSPDKRTCDDHNETWKHSQFKMSLKCTELQSRNEDLVLELNKVKHENSQLKLDIEDCRIVTADQTQHWRRSCSDSRKLEKCNKRLQVLVGKGQQDLVEKNLSLSKECDQLVAKYDSYKAVHDPKAASWRSFQNPDIQIVISKLEDLRSEIHEVSQGPSAIFPLSKGTIGKHTYLAELTQRSFSLEISDGHPNTTAMGQLCGMRLRDIFASLLSAAVCTWVFENDLGTLFHEQSLVYSTLKRLLAAHDPELALNLNLATLKKCIDDPTFQNLEILQYARHLSRRFSRSLEADLAHHQILDGDSSVASVLLDESRQLTEVFRLALDVKTRLLLTEESFRCSFHAPGTAFDGDMMEEPAERALCSQGSPAREVGVTLFPTISKYSTQRKTFSYNCFIPDDNGTELTKDEVWFRALIVKR